MKKLLITLLIIFYLPGIVMGTAFNWGAWQGIYAVFMKGFSP